MNQMWNVLFLLGVTLVTVSYAFGAVGGQMKLVSEWKSIEFIFPTILHYQTAIALREYVPGNAVPVDIDVHYQG